MLLIKTVYFQRKLLSGRDMQVFILQLKEWKEMNNSLNKYNKNGMKGENQSKIFYLEGE